MTLNKFTKDTNTKESLQRAQPVLYPQTQRFATPKTGTGFNLMLAFAVLNPALGYLVPPCCVAIVVAQCDCYCYLRPPPLLFLLVPALLMWPVVVVVVLANVVVVAALNML